MKRLLTLSLATGLFAASLAPFAFGAESFTLRYQKSNQWVASQEAKPLRDLMASTFRHNRATGVHNRALVEALVRKLAALGWSDTQISRHLGMKAEEVLRLKQARGIAEYYAHRQYSRAWVWVQVDDEPEADSQNGDGEPGDELPGLEDGR